MLEIWCLFNLYGLELASLKTHSALNTLFGVDLERFSFLLLRPLLAGDCLRRADLDAFAAGLTDIGEDSVSEKGLTDLGRASFVDDMLFIFLSEIPNGREDGIGSCPS